MIFWNKFPPKKNLSTQKQQKMNIIIESFILELVWTPNFSLNWQLWLFGWNLPKKSISGLKQESEHRHWIMHIRVNLGTDFSLKWTILTFWTKFAQKGYFQSKTEKGNITIKLCWLFGSNLPKNGIISRKWKYWTPPLILEYSN